MPRQPRETTVREKPYEFARTCVRDGKFFDFTTDGDAQRLANFGLPVFRTPQDLAAWLKMPLRRVAWLVHRFAEHQRPETIARSHYHYEWVAKKVRGERLIEAPKSSLKAVQHQILRGILDHVPPHSAAHGFVRKKSIRSNALPHVGKRVILKFDLENFYPTVTFSRVVAIFRSLGYCREAALWLARLTTSDTPDDIRDQLYRRDLEAERWRPYARRHLPQGAPTSPALANLSAFVLDLRLAGLARKFNAAYTRYADDLTFSGDETFKKSLAVFIPLVQKIIAQERFRVNRFKRRVVRNNQRQMVTGVVVNEKPNVSRRDFDELKATLVNCIRRGPSTQNHLQHPDFAAYLQGRVAHVRSLNPDRGRRLLDLFNQVDWMR